MSGIKRKRSSSSGSARLLPISKKARSTESDSGEAGGQLSRVAVEDLVPGGRKGSEAGVRPPEGRRQTPEEGGRERTASAPAVTLAAR